jgi:hypothetical protein
MGPNKQKDGKRKGSAGGAKNQRLSPHATGRNFIGEAGADARQERGRNVGIRRSTKACIDRGKERLFLGEGGAASGASREVRAQFALRHGAGGGGFD